MVMTVSEHTESFVGEPPEKARVHFEIECELGLRTPQPEPTSGARHEAAGARTGHW